MNIKNFLLNLLIISMTALIIFILPNEYSVLPYIGGAIIIVAIVMLTIFNDKGTITLLIGIIMIISISFSLSVCFNAYDNAKNWQIDLVELTENIICAKNYLLYLCIFSLSLIGLRKSKFVKEEANIEHMNNTVIAYGGIIVLIYILIFQFDRSSHVGLYLSNMKPLYEYAIVIFLFVWVNAKEKTYIRKFLILYAFFYCLQGLLYGDRSSAFPMILLIFLLHWKKSYSMKYILIIGLGGILIANFIDITRNGGNLYSMDTIIDAIDRGLNVNTISYSFYCGTQILRYGAVTTNSFEHLINYMYLIFAGGGANSSLSGIANTLGFINKGGGMAHVYFYYWGGYAGTIIFGIITGNITKKVFSTNNEICKYLRIFIIVFTIRWFVYFPIAFFRTALLVPIILYYMCELLKKIMIQKSG